MRKRGKEGGMSRRNKKEEKEKGERGVNPYTSKINVHQLQSTMLTYYSHQDRAKCMSEEIGNK